MSLTVNEISRALDAAVPEASKLGFDRVGLQVGNPSARVDHVLVALDLTPSIIEEASRNGAQMIVTHHPLLFKPVDRLVTTSLVSSMAYALAEKGIAYYAAHTNLDLAPGGVSFALAELIGLEDIRFLSEQSGVLKKLVTFVPEDHFEAIREALANAGAGQIGNYDSCVFTSPGTGYFRPNDQANPFSGKAGKLEKADELRIEAEVPEWLVGRVVSALKDAHPYEEVAYDIYSLDKTYTRTGLGAVGTLSESESLQDFLKRVSAALKTDVLHYVGDDERPIRNVAVCGGSGSSLISSAARADVDAYVTADITYHTWFEPMSPEGTFGMALIDAGHYETEWIAERLLEDLVRTISPELSVSTTTSVTNPRRTFVRS